MASSARCFSSSDSFSSIGLGSGLGMSGSSAMGWCPPRCVFDLLARLGADPDLAALEMLLLPDRHHFLQPVDGEVAGFERGAAVASGDSNHDAGFADGHDT